MLQNICSAGHISFNNVIRGRDDFFELRYDRFRNVRMTFSNMLKLSVCDNDLSGHDRSGDNFIDIEVKITYKIHVCFHTILA